jgi:hypothetical protein
MPGCFVSRRRHQYDGRTVILIAQSFLLDATVDANGERGKKKSIEHAMLRRI